MAELMRICASDELLQQRQERKKIQQTMAETMQALDCVEKLRALAWTVKYLDVFVGAAPPTLYVDTWFVHDAERMSNGVTAVALLSRLKGIDELKAREEAARIWEVDLTEGARYGIYVNSEPGVAFLHELFLVAWPPRDHGAVDLLDEYVDNGSSSVCVWFDLHFSQSQPRAQTLPAIRSIADVFARRDQLTLALKWRSDWGISIQELSQIEAIASAGGEIQCIPALDVGLGNLPMVSRALQILATDVASEVDVNCSNNECFPAVLSAIGPSIDIPSLGTLTVDLREFTPADLEVVNAFTQSTSPCADLLRVKPEAVKWLRGPSGDDGYIPAVIQGDYKTSPFAALLPGVGEAEVDWSDDFEVCEWNEIPLRTTAPTISTISIASMTQESATPSAGLLRLIGKDTEHLTVRHSTFTGYNGETTLYKWWKKVFSWCPSISSVSKDQISMPQATLMLRAASAARRSLRSLELTVHDATSLTDFLTVISRERHWKTSLRKLVIPLKTNSMQRCTRLHSCTEASADRPPRSLFDDSEIERIHEENAIALQSLFTHFSSEHQLSGRSASTWNKT